MQISISATNASDGRQTIESRPPRSCTTLKCLLLLLVIVALVLYVCNLLGSTLLKWLEAQDALVIYLFIIVFFSVVSFPFSVGYLLLVIASGYLFGLYKGLVLSIVGANAGVFVAHRTMRLLQSGAAIQRLLSSETAQAIMRVISGPMSSRIVLCTRLTPIPFGFQNAIFALSNIQGRMYHYMTLLGLIPGQIVGVYLGSSLRSMQEVFDDSRRSSFTYVFALLQLGFAICLLVWLGAKARRELQKAILEAENRFAPEDKKTLISSFVV